MRELRRSKTVSLEAMLERDPDAPVFAEQRSYGNPPCEVDSRDMLERFEIVLQELPPSYRETFVLHHVQDISYEDIATLTGDSVGSLKVRAHRARKLLRERLFPEANHMTPEDVVG